MKFIVTIHKKFNLNEKFTGLVGMIKLLDKGARQTFFFFKDTTLSSVNNSYVYTDPNEQVALTSRLIKFIVFVFSYND